MARHERTRLSAKGTALTTQQRPILDQILTAQPLPADVAVIILDITPGVPHVFQAFAALLDEADAALNRAARFVQDNTAQRAAA